MKFNDLSIKWQLLLPALAGPVVTAMQTAAIMINRDLASMKNQLQGVIKGIITSADTLEDKSGELRHSAEGLNSGSSALRLRELAGELRKMISGFKV